ncbi:MAG: transcription antitermination factor NusB [Pirellulales bacterium]
MPLNRRRAREVALQVLYADDLNPSRNLAEADDFLIIRLHRDAKLCDFARSIVSGVRRARQDIDERLSRLASNWSLDRMAAIDRNILRLGAFELLHTATPPRVVVNESIELAKRYGGKQSHQFVNGILDRLMPRSAGPGARPAGPNPSGGASGKGTTAHKSGAVRKGAAALPGQTGLFGKVRIKKTAKVEPVAEQAAPQIAEPAAAPVVERPMERVETQADAQIDVQVDAQINVPVDSPADFQVDAPTQERADGQGD